MAVRKYLGTITDGLLVIAAFVVVILLLRREVIGRSHTTASVPPQHAQDWQRFLADGHLIGSVSASVKLVVFADFQCPACAYMHIRVRRLLTEYADKVAVVYRHFPLSIHPTALMAALAAECAADQGKFESFSDVLFVDQQWIGVSDWEDFARAAEVRDLAEFDRCMRERDFADRVRADMAAARELGVVATPTVLVDGVLLSGVTGAELEERVRKAVDSHNDAGR